MRYSHRFESLIPGGILILLLLLSACSVTPQPDAPTNPVSEQSSGQTSEQPADASEELGTLQFRANGEDFVREGFETADGWSLTFDHVYVTLADITAYQSDPPFDADAGGDPQAQVMAVLDGVHTVDLAAGDEQAEPVLIGETETQAGRYNALSWRMVPATNGPARGAVIMIQGTAEKGGETLPFTIKLDKENTHVCGDFVGDERKGILNPGGTADLESTFHFDHLFGDGSMPPDDEINTGALGFAPFSALAQDGKVEVNMSDLEAALSAEEYEKLSNLHLAHVGEGHCTSLTAQS